jgi:hypothetical protein
MLICENCVNGCELECHQLSDGMCMLRLSPYHSPCVRIHAPTKSFLSSLHFSVPFTAKFQTGECCALLFFLARIVS